MLQANDSNESLAYFLAFGESAESRYREGTSMAESQSQKQKALAFRLLHHGPRALLLPNAWDVVSARILQGSGVAAIATSSAGIAFSLGYADGQKISRSEMLHVVARIVAAVNLPVTADVEAGYGQRPEDAAETALAVIEAGAVGMNLEDAKLAETKDAAHPLIDLSLQLERIAAVKEAANAVDVPLVLNARTDIYLKQVGVAESRYDEALRRLTAFRDTGADCVFAPAVDSPEIIRNLARDLAVPLNILAGPGSPSVAELESFGVARISLGSSVMRATLGLLQRIAAELRGAGTYHSLEGAPSYAEVNRLMTS